jgi:fumarate hydratase class II
MSKTRIERDSMGELEVPADALYGAQTQRAVQNFPVSGWRMPVPFLREVARIKGAAAEVNRDLGLLDTARAEAITADAQALVDGSHADQFPIDVFQTGSGTSTNMNVNEVIARLAGRKDLDIHPNDHVNLGQSSNDVIPAALHLSVAMELRDTLLPAMQVLKDELDKRANELDEIIKTGRTHLMDAMPVRVGQEVGGWAAQVSSARQLLEEALPRLGQLALGGTAVGTGVNTHPEFTRRITQVLSRQTGLFLRPADDFFAALSSQDIIVAVSGVLKAYACAIMKIANDLRWMNSGPLAGLGEIELPALQPGSSIMPGKVNPVIPEAACQVAAQVIGNDAAITIGGQSGNFQLNVMLPMIAHNIHTSIRLLANISGLMAHDAVHGFTVREENLRAPLARNPILVTALNPIIGYQKAAEIAKTAYRTGRPIIDVAEEMTTVPRDELERLLNPARLTRGGL